MKIYLTEDTADFGTRLRREFMCGIHDKRYSPQTKTPFNALISDFETNGNSQALLEGNEQPNRFRVSRSFYPLNDGSEYHKLLDKVGNIIRGTTPSKSDEKEYRRFLEIALERIAVSYAAEKDWFDTRQIVKSFIVQDYFKKQKEQVAFDVPSDVWRKFAANVSVGDDDEVLKMMDVHIANFCAIGESRLRDFFAEKKEEIAVIRKELPRGESRFVVLYVGGAIKEMLNTILNKNFEPYLVTLLHAEPPRPSPQLEHS